LRYRGITICLILSVNLAFGQVKNKILFDRIFIPGLIAQNPITSITQDHFGLLWFSTFDGIHRYNGYQFELHSITPDGPLSSVVDYRGLQVLNDSILLVGTNAGIARFNYITNSFTFHPVKTTNGQPVGIRQIYIDRNSTIWLNAESNGIFSFDRSGEINSVVDQSVTAMGISPTGMLQYASNNVLYEIHNSTSIQKHTLDEGVTITSLAYNGANLLLGTANSGLFENTSKGFSNILNLNYAVTKIFQDQDSQIWVLTDREGLYVYSNGSFSHYTKDFYDRTSISADRTISIFQESNKTIWIGTSAGINRYDPYKTKFKYFKHLPLKETSLSADLVRGIYEDSDENLWLATEDGTVNKLPNGSNVFQKRKIGTRTNKIIPYDFYDLNTSEILVATSKGMYLVDKALQYHKPHPILTFKKLTNSRARAIVPYRNDTLLILSEGQVGVYNLKTNVFKFLELKPSKEIKATQAMDQFARTIYQDPQGILWIGSYGVVAKVNIQSQTAEYYTFDDSRGPMVMYIERLADTLWVGTFNGGLVKIDLNTKAFRKYTTSDGLPNNAIYAAISDENGNLWLSTNNGVCRFNINSEETEIFDINDGLQGAEFNRLAFTKRKNGEIALGGVNGFNLFNPHNIEKNPHSPKSIILDVEILNEFVGNNEYLHPKMSLLGKETLDLSHEHNFLRFNYCASHFSTANDNKYYYQLENFDDNWVYAGNKNSATYTGLKHGNYIFKVKSISPDGVEEVQHASINININAPFWMKWWFYAILVSLIGLITYVAIDRRLKQTKAIKLLLEKEIERRTHELKKSKDELSDLNQKKDFIFSILSHDLRAPLTTLEGFLGLLVEHYEQMTPKEIKAHATSIKNSVGKSLDLIDNTLYWSLSQMGNINYNPMTVSVKDLIEKVKGLYILTAKKKSIKLTFDTEDDLFIAADENMSYIILRNLVSNALKFTPKYKAVNVKAYKEGGFVAIEIVDEGIGITPESIKKLFDKKPNLSQRGTSNEKGAGLGLILCKKFIELHKGEISATSNGSHTTFKVTFPIANRSVSNDPNPEPV